MMKKLLTIHLSPADGSLTDIYKSQIGGYPKFYKMDPLARLGFVASELLLDKEHELTGEERFREREDRAIVLVNRSASLAADRKYEKTIVTGDDYFPSPADFVYTLPNIVTGEIAIRNHYYGESNFKCVEDKEAVEQLVALAFADQMTTSVLGGWLECKSAEDYEAELSIWTRQ